MALRDAVRGLGLALGFRAAKKKIERDMASAVADELERRERARKHGSNDAGTLVLGTLLVFGAILLIVWAVANS